VRPPPPPAGGGGGGGGGAAGGRGGGGGGGGRLSFLESRGRYTKVGVYCYCAERCVR